MTILMCDLNAKVGNEQDPLLEVGGRHGLDSRNERGDIWVDWCMTHDQVITNPWFQHHNMYAYTWKSPGDGARNQIDYITINNRSCNPIQHMKGYHRAAQLLSSSQTTIRDMKPTQHKETTPPDNLNLKLVFHKVASFHPHYLAFTLQTDSLQQDGVNRRRHSWLPTRQL